MRSTPARVAIGLVTVAVVVLLFVVAGGGDDDGGESTTTTTPAQTQTSETTSTAEQPQVAADEQITVRDGRPVGGIKELSYESGDRVRFVVTSDTADEVHVHGYDLTQDLPAGGSTRFSFPASLEGVFEVELHGSERQIAELRVSP